MKRSAAVAFLAVFAASAVQAVPIYSNFGPGNSYSSTMYPVTGPGVPGYGQYAWAMPFTPDADYYLDSINIGSACWGLPNSFDVALCANASQGLIPGTPLESWSGVTWGFASNSVNTVISVTNPLLMSGHRYWLVAIASGDTEGASFQNSTHDVGGTAYSRDGVHWTSDTGPRGAFAIFASPVPEPATVALFGLGLLGLLRRRRACPQTDAS